ncbi:MAG: thioredoxin domain-containing protein [Planctomycetaceae bacterium]|nr:thioredoxin domain-containing protein [Planctomycetaceae bacterium]HCK40024.1 thioredoxin domain-containing protein [Planctomycetaceae bacterium]
MPNHLADETSPYLLQHKNNPVDWYPWGPEALDRAKREKKPIFLSIGYSACHWCHVMEHESFENEAIAKELNHKFVCIKVDREERPDLDQIYMNATQIMTGRGGWPMSVFLTPELKPFFAGTYWPPSTSRGMIGFDQVIAKVSDAWVNNRDAVATQADRLTQELVRMEQTAGSDEELTKELLVNAYEQHRKTFDSNYGGFGSGPNKFPAPMSLQLLLRYWHRHGDQQSLNMVVKSLDRMAAGGIYDHLGGGFARYTVDPHWLVPHFEKMLYDNAQLVTTYVEAYQVTGDENYARVVRETLDYILRDMTDPQGGFYSTEDADSEGVEGKFYTWTPPQVQEILDEEAAATFCQVYDVTDAGNFEHTNILNLRKTLEQQAKLLGIDLKQLTANLEESRAKLFAAREKRVHPHKDDKVIVAWNGLMIDAMARAGSVLGEKKYIDAGKKTADFLLDQLRSAEGRLLHTWRHGQAKLAAYLDDYACLANGLVSLYEANFEEHYLEQAATLMQVVLRRFQVENQGGFYYTADDQEKLIVRSKDFLDNAVPSGNAMAATVLIRLAKFTGDQNYQDAAKQTMLATMEYMQRSPSATCQTLIAVDFQLGPTYELAFACDRNVESSRQALAEIQGRFLPNKVFALVAPDTKGFPAISDLLQGKTMLGDAPTLYLCEGFTCQAPAQGQDEIQYALDKLMPQSLLDRGLSTGGSFDGGSSE